MVMDQKKGGLWWTPREMKGNGHPVLPKQTKHQREEGSAFHFASTKQDPQTELWNEPQSSPIHWVFWFPVCFMPISTQCHSHEQVQKDLSMDLIWVMMTFLQCKEQRAAGFFFLCVTDKSMCFSSNLAFFFLSLAVVARHSLKGASALSEHGRWH